MPDFAAQRLNMLESQLRPNQIGDAALLAAMAELPRELFLPKRLSGIAYVDEDIPLGGGRVLMQPLVLARLIQGAAVGARESVLDVACGTGYSTALLSRLARRVIGLESAHDLALQASRLLVELNIRNAAIVEGPLPAGHPAAAPYDVILLGGSVEEVPRTLTDQLADGGRLLTVLRPDQGIGKITLFERLDGIVASRVLDDGATAPLAGFARPAQFVF